MSNMPLVPPILPLPDDEVNAPEPESERADELKARRAEKLVEGKDILDTSDRDDRLGLITPDDDEVDVEIAAAKKREGKA